MQTTSRIRGLDNDPTSAVGATVLRGSQCEPLPALLFLRSSHSDDRLPPQLSGSVLHLFVCDEVALLARPAGGLVMGRGTEGNTHHNEREVLVHVAFACPQLPALGG